jgi:hypothetical protein
MRATLIACVLPILAATQEAAARDNACGQIPVTAGREVEPFATYLPIVDSAQALPKEGVFRLRLQPMSDVIYPIRPDRGSDSAYGGYVTLESIPAGLYRILLSTDGWIDAIQRNAKLPIVAFDSKSDCPGVRQTIEVDVRNEPLTFQIGGVPGRTIDIAVRRIWDFQWRW